MMTAQTSPEPGGSPLRGELNPQQALFSYVSPEARVPATHPLRAIKTLADQVLASLSPIFDKLDSQVGRPSIPPERLLKGAWLIALFSLRGRRLFCEELDDHILFRWVLDMSLDEPVFDHSTFSQNSERLLQHDVARRVFEAVVGYAQQAGLLSDEPVTVDGTLIEAWASLKSLNPKAAAPAAPPPDDPGNPTVDFHGERHTNATPQSTTDPEARLARKGPARKRRAVSRAPCSWSIATGCVWTCRWPRPPARRSGPWPWSCAGAKRVAGFARARSGQTQGPTAATSCAGGGGAPFS
ncbi:MAG TPA: transposase, partial [Acidobacteriaceae bacterium]|nr:transposase [Acidobacteriaceae bacterium]